MLEETPESREIFSLDVLAEAITRYDPVAVFALFSGGYDSLCATHLVAQHPRFTAAVHIDTTIGIEETRVFVRETSERQGWPLREYRPTKTYDEIVLEYGFPGPDAHRFMYRTLKERPVRQLIRECQTERSQKVILVTGVRSDESVRRMGNVHPIQVIGSQVWVSVIHDWSKADVLDYRDLHGLPRNPVVDAYHHSGECLCGAFAREGELAEIALWYPKTAARIHALEERARDAGIERAQWGKQIAERSGVGLMCSSCEVNG